MELKQFIEFHKHNCCLFGYNTVCKECRKVDSKRQYSYQTPEYKLFYNAKWRAQKNNFPFNIEETDIHIPELCPALGIPLDSELGQMNAPSLDRIEPDKGYTKGNIAVISYKANMIKSNATFEEIKAVADWLKGFVDGCEVTTI